MSTEPASPLVSVPWQPCISRSRNQGPNRDNSVFVSEERGPNLANLDAEMSGNLADDPVKRPYPNSTVARHY
jgi:hypothetical protein